MSPASIGRRIIEEGTSLSIGDPARMAAIMIDSAAQKPAPKRIALGSDAYTIMHKQLGERLAALEAQKASGVQRVMVGLVLDDKGVLRHGQKVLTANGEGEILSGSFAPTLNKAVAFARIPVGTPGDVRVDIRGREVPVRLVKYPFVRDGKPCEGI